MSGPRREPNVGVAHGAWGEEVAAEYLRRRGYAIVARNVRPCGWDARLEIDVIAYDTARDILVFVEVKQHRARSPYARRLRSVGAGKMRRLRTTKGMVDLEDGTLVPYPHIFAQRQPEGKGTT